MADKIEDLIQENEHNKFRAKSWQDFAMKLAEQRDAAYRRNAELEARIEALEAEVMQQHGIAATCAAECERLEDDKEKLNQVLRGVSSRLTEVFDQLQKSESERDKAARKIAQLESEIKYLRSTDHAADVAASKLEWINEALNEGDGAYRP